MNVARLGCGRFHQLGHTHVGRSGCHVDADRIPRGEDQAEQQPPTEDVRPQFPQPAVPADVTGDVLESLETLLRRPLGLTCGFRVAVDQDRILSQPFPDHPGACGAALAQDPHASRVGCHHCSLGCRHRDINFSIADRGVHSQWPGDAQWNLHEPDQVLDLVPGGLGWNRAPIDVRQALLGALFAERQTLTDQLGGEVICAGSGYVAQWCHPAVTIPVRGVMIQFGTWLMADNALESASFGRNRS